ncbi:MAG: HEAT repeat domain-containing protein, partial [Myxococcales bacterium]|nr:HEAT repeat domain-containing protein [Myxococcales bacterium]
IGTMHGWVDAARAEPSPWQPRVQPSDGSWSWGLLLDAPAGEALDAPVEAALVGLAPPEAVERYLALVHGRRTTAEYAGLLREWLRANPAGAEALVAMLEAGRFDDEPLARSALYYALATADTPQATAALVGLVDGEDTRLAHRVSAAQALAKLEHPPAEVVEVLAAQATRTDVHPVARGSLTMALGTLAHELDGRAPELAAQARARIEGWLEAPTDDDALSSALLAAGNAGHDALADAIAPYLRHEQPRIRQKAAHALRQMSPQEAFPRLERGLDDAEPSVRVEVLASAAEVSRSHGVPPPPAMIDAAADGLGQAHERSEERALIALLGEAARRGSDDARGALRAQLAQELARDDRDPARLRALGAHADTHWQAD